MIQEASEPPVKAGAPYIRRMGTKSPPAKAGVTGELSHIAMTCLIKIMYIAWFARQDALRAIAGALTPMITNWDEACNRQLSRIIKRIKETVEWRHIGFTGDSPSTFELGLFSDADFAGAGPT